MNYRYKLRDCEVNKDINQMQVNGIKVYKYKWIYSKNYPIEKFEKFLENRLDHEQISNEDLIKEQLEEARIRKDREDVNKIFKDINISLGNEQPEEIKKPEISVIEIRENMIKEYIKLTKKQIIDKIIEIDPKLYDIKQFYGIKKEGLIQTLLGIQGY